MHLLTVWEGRGALALLHGTPREHASTWVISGAARGVGDLRMSLRNKPSEQHRRTLLRARACVSNELRRIPHRSMLIKQVMAYIAYNEASHVKGFKTIFFTRPNVRYRLAQARSRSPYACSTLPAHCQHTAVASCATIPMA